MRLDSLHIAYTFLSVCQTEWDLLEEQGLNL